MGFFSKRRQAQAREIERLARRIDELEKAAGAGGGNSPSAPQPESRPRTQAGRQAADASPPIVIEYVHIERFVVDKMDYENNFGALGIRELTGQLNIGANYGTEPSGGKPGGGIGSGHKPAAAGGGIGFSHQQPDDGKPAAAGDCEAGLDKPAEADGRAWPADRRGQRQEGGPRYTINPRGGTSGRPNGGLAGRPPGGRAE